MPLESAAVYKKVLVNIIHYSFRQVSMQIFIANIVVVQMRQETIVDKHPTGHHHHHQQGNTAYGTASGKQL